MAKMRRYACPDCSGLFDYLHHPNVTDDPAPRFCPLCGFDTHAEDAPLELAVTAPYLSTGTAKNVDGIWDAEQRGSEFRAQMAMEAGLSTAEANNLKVTDMKDNLREGDTTAVEVNNAVTQVMAQAPNQFGFVGGAQMGLGYSQAAHTGPSPNAGARAMQAVRNQHSLTGAPLSERPANETMQPGYKRRA